MNQSRANNVGTVFSFLALTVRIPLLVFWVFFFCGSARHELAGGLIETHHSIGSVMIASQSSTSQRSIGPHSGGGMRPLGKKKYSVNGNTVTTCQWPSAGARVWPFNGGQRSARNAQKKTTKKKQKQIGKRSANGGPGNRRESLASASRKGRRLQGWLRCFGMLSRLGRRSFSQTASGVSLPVGHRRHLAENPTKRSVGRFLAIPHRRSSKGIGWLPPRALRAQREAGHPWNPRKGRRRRRRRRSRKPRTKQLGNERLFFFRPSCTRPSEYRPPLKYRCAGRLRSPTPPGKTR